MKIAMLFPGQGSQTAGMGRKLLELHQVVDKINACSDIASLPLIDYVLHLSDAALRETERSQPAIFALSVGIAQVLLDKGVVPFLFAGHSLGHFTALAVSGAIELSSATKLVASRSALMAKSKYRCNGGMGAVQNLQAHNVLEALQKLGLSLWIANYNLIDQFVISGYKEDLKTARKILTEMGGRWTTLNVSGAFHSPMLHKEAEEFSFLIDAVEIQEPSAPLVCNKTGELLKDPKVIRDNLKKHMVTSVNWVAVMDKLGATDISFAIESGPGKTLTGLMMRHNRNIHAMNTTTPLLISRAVDITVN